MSPISNGFLLNSFNDPNHALPDLSSLMFPSDDPFQYPQQGQPLSNFDNGMAGQPGPDFTTIFPSASMPTSNPSASQQAPPRQSFIPPSSSFNPKGVPDTPNNGDTEVQLLGPMPMFMMQGGNNQQQAHNFVGLPPNNNNINNNSQQNGYLNDFGLFDGQASQDWQQGLEPESLGEWFAGTYGRQYG